VRAESFRWAVRGAGLALGVAAVLAVLQIAPLAKDVLVLVFIAVLLASALEPAVDAVRGRVSVPRGVVILAVYATFFAAVAVLALIVVPAAIVQLTALASQAPDYFDRATAWAASLQPSVLGAAVTALLEAAQKSLVATPPKPGQVVEAGLTVAQVVASAVTMLAVVFFWLVEHATLQRYALSFLPAERRAGAREAWDDVELRLGQWVRGQLTLMGVMAVATGVLYTILGLPSPLLLGLIAGLAEGIPIVGPLLGAIPALVLAATISPQLVLVVAVAYVVIQFVESNVLVPIVMKHTVGLSAFLVIVSILVGAAIAGIPGAFLAVPLMAAFEVILERLEAREVPVTQTAIEPEVVDEPRPRGRRKSPTRPERPRRSAPATGRPSATS
jgi:predicted PurR-regulated permease PerM